MAESGTPFGRGVEGIHDLDPTAEGAEGEAPAQHLAEAAQVGLGAAPGLSAAQGEAQGDHLVDHEQGADLGHHLPDTGQVARGRRDHPRRAHHRLHEDGRQVGADRTEDGGRRIEVVEREHHGVGQGRPAQPVGSRHRVGVLRRPRLVRAGVGADEDIVLAPVVRPFGLGDLRAAGERPGRPDRVECGLSARRAEADPLQTGQAGCQPIGHLDLELGRPREARPPVQLRPHRVEHHRMGVAVDQRGVVVGQVDQLVAVDVPDPAARAPVGEERMRRVVQRAAGVAPGEGPLGGGEEGRRARRALGVAPGLRGDLSRAHRPPSPPAQRPLTGAPGSHPTGLARRHRRRDGPCRRP